MTHPAPTFGQIRAKVQAVRRKAPDAAAVGIHSPGRYAGDRVRRDGADTYRIEQCDSPLAARIALLGDEPGATVTVLVTGLPDHELGEDVLVRLAGRRLYPLDPWQIVKELFQAHAVDPRLRGHGWVADRLLELAPAAGLPAAAGGYLDAEAVWPVLLQRLIGLEGDRPDLPLLLHWSASAENVGRFRRLPDEPRRAVEGWLAASLGPAAAAVLRCVRSADQPDAVPVGLALGVVHHPAAAGRLDRAAGRLERFLGGPTPDPAVADRWHAAATDAVRLLDADMRARNGLLNRAEEVLREVQADDHAHLTDVLPRGFEQRLARLGGLLAAAGDGPPPVAELTAAREAVRRHDQARREPRRVERVDMALRLARWLAAGREQDPRSLGEAADGYMAHGSFVDWARSALRAGDPVRELSEGYARLLERVAAGREAQNRTFAELLRDQTAAATRPADLLPVEAVLDQLVAPLAALAPVLVVLLDGMSPAVSRELTADLARLDWATLGPGGRPVPPGLAAIPCVTEASRASLFCGKLTTGAAADEAAGFAAHPALKAHCRSGQPPVLFHKVALSGPGDAALAANVREAVASPQKRVVGVVVNAVDDHLLRGEQLDLRWTRDEIKVLLPLLYEARSARRVVVLLSDHGHLLDQQTRAADGAGGERWRPDDGRPGDGELPVRGPRVLLGDCHRLIAPWTERLRYGARKNGYHGGLTPQEMLIPVTVLAAGDLRPDGWADAPDPTPDWWEPAPAQAAPPPALVVPSRPAPPKAPKGLFDTEEAPVPVAAAGPPAAPHPAWVAALLASPVFAGQKKLGGRAVPDDATVAGLLAALDEAGGKLTAAALARRLGLPPFRLRGLLAVCQRVLNVDGYAVLGRDEPSDTVELDRPLLLRQFDLVAEDRP